MPTSYTVDELAARCGTTVRTIREYQTLGVLPPPEKRGRVAYYGDRHEDRLRSIARLQERGYSLAGIRDLFDAWDSGASVPGVLGMTDTPVIGALDETPSIVSIAALADELPRLFGSGAAIRRAHQAGLVRKIDGDRVAIRSTALLSLVADAVELGVPVADALALCTGIHETTTTIARTAVATLDHVGADDLVAFVTRARSLLAQAVASSLIGHVGDELRDRAAEDPALSAVFHRVRIGEIDDRSAGEPPADHPAQTRQRSPSLHRTIRHH